MDKRDPNFASLENVSQSPSKYTLAGNGSSRMLFHRTREGPIPGVGDYDITKNSIKNKKKSPTATIGNAVRFPG